VTAIINDRDAAIPDVLRQTIAPALVWAVWRYEVAFDPRPQPRVVVA
jgi:hypothetical protein